MGMVLFAGCGLFGIRHLLLTTDHCAASVQSSVFSNQRSVVRRSPHDPCGWNQGLELLLGLIQVEAIADGQRRVLRT